MPTREMSYQGYLAAAALCQRMRREAGVGEVLEGDVVEGLGAVAGSHAVDVHDDEAELGQGLVGGSGAEGLRHKGALRPGVDVLDDRIFPVGIEVERFGDGAPDVGLAVAALGDEDLGKAEAGGEQGGGVSLVEIEDDLLVVAAAELGDGRPSAERAAARRGRRTDRRPGLRGRSPRERAGRRRRRARGRGGGPRPGAEWALSSRRCRPAGRTCRASRLGRTGGSSRRRGR